MRHQGRLHDWNDNKGFGFVTPNGGGEKAFVHIKAFPGRTRRPADGDIVTYTMTHDARGRPQAVDIRFANTRTAIDKRRTSSGPSPRIIAPVLALTFIAGLIGAALSERLPVAVAGVYTVMSAIAFLAYGIDKSSAKAGRRRTPESTLHVLGLACGWPGALCAQRVFRHKSSKRTFQAVFWATVVLNLVALSWWTGTHGPTFAAGFSHAP